MFYRKLKFSMCCLRDVILEIKRDLSTAYKILQLQGGNSVGPPCTREQYGRVEVEHDPRVIIGDVFRRREIPGPHRNRV